MDYDCQPDDVIMQETEIAQKTDGKDRVMVFISPMVVEYIYWTNVKPQNRLLKKEPVRIGVILYMIHVVLVQVALLVSIHSCPVLMRLPKVIPSPIT